MARVTIADVLSGMTQTEADVVMVAWSPDRNVVSVTPMWECTMCELELAQYAAQYALRCAEHAGVGGSIEVSWIDYRPLRVPEEGGEVDPM